MYLLACSPRERTKRVVEEAHRQHTLHSRLFLLHAFSTEAVPRRAGRKRLSWKTFAMLLVYEQRRGQPQRCKEEKDLARRKEFW
eukprot:scaffold5636_cov159-Ochromonas_danica.AAC.25